MSVEMMIKKLTMEEALESISNYEHGLLYRISSVDIVSVAEMGALDTSDFQEAYFFDEKKQLHIYQADEGLAAVMITDEEGCDEHTLLKIYPITGKHNEKAKKVTVKEYLDFDEDGQVYVAYTRLVKLV